MILKGSQRGGALGLAAHLLNGHDNEHVEVHQIRNFIADDLRGALQEARAVASGTRCKQFLFSLALSPPPGVAAPNKFFEAAIDQVEAKLCLTGQPRAIVFHEKQGRRHAHCVWSRILPEMKAINLPFYKSKLMEVFKELFLAHGWNLPPGMIDRSQRNPLNFTREQWEQAKRAQDSPKVIKQVLQECWAVSDSKQAFENALDRKGYYLAKGDRRGYVAVDWRGEVYSLSRWLDVPSKSLKARLGPNDVLPSVEQTRNKIDRRLQAKVGAILDEMRAKANKELRPYLAHRDEMTQRHQQERTELQARQQAAWQQASQARNARLRKGWLALVDHFTGKRRKVLAQNQQEAYKAAKDDQYQRDQLVARQLSERAGLQARIVSLQGQHQRDAERFRQSVFAMKPDERQKTVLVTQSLDRHDHEPRGPTLTF